MPAKTKPRVLRNHPHRKAHNPEPFTCRDCGWSAGYTPALHQCPVCVSIPREGPPPQLEPDRASAPLPPPPPMPQPAKLPCVCRNPGCNANVGEWRICEACGWNQEEAP